VTDPKLSSRDRAHLRSLAHHLQPVIRLGAEGPSSGVVEATSTALEEHELIKVRFGSGYVGDRRNAARELAEATRADLVQVIGRVAVLYRPPSEAPSEAPEQDLVPGGPTPDGCANAAPRAPKIILPGARSGPAGRTTKPPR
jgi:RNA-binding protein